MCHCASHSSAAAHFYLYKASAQIDHLCSSAIKILMEVPSSSNTPHIHVINLFRNPLFRIYSSVQECLCLYLKINCLLYSTISYNHIYYINSYLNYIQFTIQAQYPLI